MATTTPAQITRNRIFQIVVHRRPDDVPELLRLMHLHGIPIDDCLFGQGWASVLHIALPSPSFAERLMRDGGADANVYITRCFHGYTVFQEACKYYPETAKVMLRYGADPRKPHMTHRHCNALSCAASADDLDLVRLLMEEHGMRPSVNDVRSAVIGFCRPAGPGPRLAVVEYLLDLFDPATLDPGDLLHVAARYGHLDIVRLLAQLFPGGHPSFRGVSLGDGEPAAMAALRFEYKDDDGGERAAAVLEAVLSVGASADEPKTKEGWTRNCPNLGDRPLDVVMRMRDATARDRLAHVLFRHGARACSDANAAAVEDARDKWLAARAVAVRGMLDVLDDRGLPLHLQEDIACRWLSQGEVPCAWTAREIVTLAAGGWGLAPTRRRR